MAQVVVELNGSEVLRRPLKGAALVIGRDKAADIHLDNRALSRKHARLEKKGAAIWVSDLESQNGTFVNGERINEPRALNSGDVIEVGRYQLRIEGVEEANPNTPVLTLTGPEGRHRFAMVGEEIIIGRAPSCDIAIGHKSISRRHLRISVSPDGQFYCEDLGSQNGSRLNGNIISGPTPITIGDTVHMSEFAIELGFLEAEVDHTHPDRASKTMMIDRSELAKAAYVDGDIGNMRSSAGRLAVGRGPATGASGPQDADGLAHDEVSATRGIPAAEAHDLLPSTSARLTVAHPDTGERQLELRAGVMVLGEDGSDGDSNDGAMFANQGYVVFVHSGRSTVVTVAGDRRLVTVNGVPRLYASLEPGDTVEFGVLTALFQR